MKSRDGQRQREEKSRREQIREEKESEEKKMQMREKVGKSRNTMFFQWFVASAGAEPSGQMRDEKLHAIVARSTSAS